MAKFPKYRKKEKGDEIVINIFYIPYQDRSVVSAYAFQEDGKSDEALLKSIDTPSQ